MNWYGSARSNYFKVKDTKQFDTLLNKWSLTKTEDEEGRVSFYSDKGLPSIYENEDGTEENFDNFLEDLISCLKPNEVAVLQEVGTDNYYLSGLAIAVNSKGRKTQIRLDDIYTRAKKLGKNITKI